MSLNKKIKLEEDATQSAGQNTKQLDYSNVKIKEEIEVFDYDDHTSIGLDVTSNFKSVSKIKIESVESDIDSSSHYVCETTQTGDIKDEITFEQFKLQEHSKVTDDDCQTLNENVTVPNNEQENDADVKPSFNELQFHPTDSNNFDETKYLEDNEIKTEITIEETKVAQYSEFESNFQQYSCELCDFRCNNRGTLWNHAKVAHPENSGTRCLICFARFKGTANLEKHIEAEHQGLGNICKICSSRYKKGQWLKHEKECLGRLLFVCKNCEQQYVTKDGLLKHLDDHGILKTHKESSITELRVKEQLFSCVICKDGKAYKRGCFKKHKEQHLDCGLKCPYCGKKFSNPSDGYRHMKQFCKITPDKLIRKNNNISSAQQWKSKTCNECEITFKNARALRYHKVKHHQQPPSSLCIENKIDENVQIKHKSNKEKDEIQENSQHGTNKNKLFCNMCDFSCGCRTSLMVHTRKAHPEDRKILCSICRTMFNGLSDFKKHIAEAHDGFGNECSICLTQYREDQKADHKAQCLGCQLFDCDHCKISFLKKEQLLKHLDEHGVPEDQKAMAINERRIKKQFYRCEICADDRAYEKRFLKKHAKEQHGGYYLICPDCGKTFNNNSIRKDHIKKYCRVGPARERFNSEQVKCPECFKLCRNEVALEDHITRCHRKTSMQCTECEIQFSSGRKLQQHMVEFHIESSICCSYCSKKFKLESQLRTHLASHQNQ